jgi:hypothetical protein
MNRRNSWFGAVAKSIVIAAGFLIVTTPGYATENAEERRDARDTAGYSAGFAEAEVDCKAADQRAMPNAVRINEIPQGGRQVSRDADRRSAKELITEMRISAAGWGAEPALRRLP